MGRPFSFQVQEPSGSEKPWMVLIHGLGMTHRSWTDPFAEGLLKGAISFDYVLTDMRPSSAPPRFPGSGFLGCSPPLRLSQRPPVSFWEFLKKNGYGIIAWSQEKPHGPIAEAVSELQAVFSKIPGRKKIALIGHSRGGLIARKFLQERRTGWEKVSAVILLGVPHFGSSLAKSTGIIDWVLSLSGENSWQPSAVRRNRKGGS